MDDPNMTMEEYIRLEEEKARIRGKVYNYETATYGKIWYDEDVHDLRSVGTKFPAIVFNDSLTSNETLFCEPTVSSLNDNEIDFKISFDNFDDEDYTSKKMAGRSPSHLNDDHWDELKETDGEKDLEGHYTNAKPLGKALPRKEKDPGSFTLPCFINNMCFNKALADLGASVSVMPYSTYTTLGLGDLIPTKLIVELADRTVKRPKGIVENVLVGIDKFTFPVDFIILDIPEDFKTPLILGRPFLSIAHAIINVFKAKITLSVGNDKIFFKSNKPTSNIIKRVYALGLLESTKLGLETRLMGDELRKNKLQDPNFENFIEPNDPNKPIEHRRNQFKVFIPTINKGEGMDEPIIEDMITKFDNIGDNEDECKYLGFYNFCHP
ncbi:reverse transcriptase domain-containing protein [Tanacetum coccineum]|uniref:Reverse transcriptase domain-containing protein n=1 Tax=Tanacetum coccineum TaxID=301880 RepID=A0ABQ5FKA0_9ASTR